MDFVLFTDTEFLIESVPAVALAAALGFLVGMERELAGKPAGARTNILIAVGAALVTVVGRHMFGGNLDPSRIAGQVVTGIGFIGAGCILRAGGSVHGLTTAATIWLVAAIGIACGAQRGFTALAVTLVALIVLTLMRQVESWIAGSKKERCTDRVRLPAGADHLGRFMGLLSATGLAIENFEINRGEHFQEVTFTHRGEPDINHQLHQSISTFAGAFKVELDVDQE